VGPKPTRTHQPTACVTTTEGNEQRASPARLSEERGHLVNDAHNAIANSTTQERSSYRDGKENDGILHGNDATVVGPVCGERPEHSLQPPERALNVGPPTVVTPSITKETLR